MNYPQYQQYQNPMYNQQNYGQVQQYQPQYIQPQMQQLQQFQNQPKNQYCRIINNVEDIRVDEIPMDGSVGIFVTKGMDEIYAKSWNAMTGSIDTVVYKPLLENNKEEKEIVETKNNFEELQKEIDLFKNEMFDRFDKFERAFIKPNNKSNKKEV